MFPKVVCEVGFGSDPTTPISSTTWTDISPYMLDADWDKGGRQYELDRAEAGTMSVRLNNADRRFEPEYLGPIVNLVTNPSFEVDLTGWSNQGSATRTRDIGTFLYGVASQKVVTAGGSGFQGAISSSNMALTSGTVYTASYWVFGVAGQILRGVIYDTVNAYKSAGGDAGVTLVNGWQRITWTFTAVSSASAAFIVDTGNTAQAITFYLDGIQLEASAAATSYCDGSLPGCSWVGAANASASRRAFYQNVVPLRRIRLRIGENAVTNPSLETDTSDWSVGATFSIARSTTQALMGAGSLKTTFISGSASSDMGAISVTVPAAGRYAFSAYVNVPSAWNGGTISVNAENYVGSSEVTALRHDANLSLRDQWQRIYRVYDIAGGDLAGDLRLRCASFPTGTPFIYTDGFQAATLDGNGELQPYVDSVRNVWTGFVESWPPAYQQKTSFVTISCVDGFEPLAQAEIYGGPNMIHNPSFETDASQWTLVGGGALARDTTQKAAGVASGKITAHASTTPTEYRPAIDGVSGSTYYAASARVYIPSGLGITAGNVTVGLGVAGGSEVSVAAQALFDQWQTLLVPVLFTGGGEQGTFGNTAQGNSVKYRLAANRKYASKFTLDRSGVVTDLRVDVGRNYEDFGPPPGQLVTGFIYSDSAGSPNALLGESAEVTQDSWDNHQWLDLVFNPGVVLAAGTYWLGIHAGVTDNGSFFYFDTTAGSYVETADSYPDGASAGFGTPTAYTRNLAIYATYTAGAVPSDGYLFVRMAETGITKFIYVDELIMREVPVNAIGLGDPSGSDLDVSLVSLRVSRILNAAGWPVADRAIDTGVALLAAKTVDPSGGSKALSELQDAADAELGVFFCDGTGKATLHDRLRRFNPAPVATFTDSTLGPGVFPYRESGLVTSYDKTRIANDVRVSPATGETQIVTDSASRSKYMPRTLSKSLELASETQAHDLAEGILTRTKNPHLRFERLSLAPVAHETSQPGLLNTVLACEVSDCVTVRFNPPGGAGQVSKNVHLEKASFKLSKPAFLDVDWQLSPADTNTYLELDDPVLGLLDTNAVAF